jgi:hypothetical protein
MAKATKPKGSTVVLGYRLQPIVAVYHNTPEAEARKLFTKGTGIFKPIDHLSAASPQIANEACAECFYTPDEYLEGMRYVIQSVQDMPMHPGA